MKLNNFLTFFLLGIFFCGPLSAKEIIKPENLQKHKLVYALAYKNYALSDTESISLIGAKEKKIMNENYYWGEAGFGAVSGKRSGYLEGGLILGWQTEFLTNFFLDLCLFTGAGGGGSAPQGGGFIVNPNLGLGYFQNPFSVFLELGYIKFLNGGISSLTMSCNFNWQFWALNYEKN